MTPTMRMVPAVEYMRVSPSHVERLERKGWEVVGASLFADDVIQVLMMRRAMPKEPANGDM